MKRSLHVALRHTIMLLALACPHNFLLAAAPSLSFWHCDYDVIDCEDVRTVSQIRWTDPSLMDSFFGRQSNYFRALELFEVGNTGGATLSFVVDTSSSMFESALSQTGPTWSKYLSFSVAPGSLQTFWIRFNPTSDVQGGSATEVEKEWFRWHNGSQWVGISVSFWAMTYNLYGYDNGERTNNVGLPIHLNGVRASGCHPSAAFNWSFYTCPATPCPTFSNPTGQSPTFVPTTPGQHVVDLKMSVSTRYQPATPIVSLPYRFLVDVAGKKPDLAFGGVISVTPNPVIAGDDVTFTYAIRNQGDGGATESHTKIQVKTLQGALITEQVFETASIAAGATANETRTLSIPSSTVAGSYYVSVVLDCNNELSQSDTSNDQRTEIFGISAARSICITSPNLSQRIHEGENAASQTFEVWNCGSGTLSYSVFATENWLSVEPSNGDSSGERDTLTENYATKALAVGTYTATIRISGTKANNSQSIGVTLYVDPGPPTITTSSPLPLATENDWYSVVLQASGGTTPYVWSLVAGSFLPPGLFLSNAGVISGNPSSSGSYTFGVRVTGDNGLYSGRDLTVLVNARPSVRISSPGNGTVFVAPETITVMVDATDLDGTVTKVEYFLNGTKLGQDTTSPYGFTLPDLTVGEYIFAAVATDNLGATRTSDAVTISVHSNDNFVDRKRVSGTLVSVRGANASATSEVNEPSHAGFPAHKSVWWTWTAPSDGTATISTFGSSFDTRLAVYTGNLLLSLHQEASNDDFGGEQTSGVNFSVFQGVTYHIAVDGFGGAFGDITLSITLQPPGSAPVITTTSPLPDAMVGEDYAVTLQAVGSGVLTWAVVSGTRPTGVDLDPSSGRLAGIPSAAGTFSFEVQVTAGGIAAAVVSTQPAGPLNNTATKPFQLTVLPPVNSPLNDHFAGATEVTETPARVTASNVNATHEAGEPHHAGYPASRSVWWTWRAPGSGPVTISTRLSNFDTLLSIYTGGSVNALSLVASNDEADDAYGMGWSKVTFQAAAGTTYRIAVDGYAGEFGHITLNISGPMNEGDGYPGAVWKGEGVNAERFLEGRRSVERIVIHDTEGGAQGTLNCWRQAPSEACPMGSAHYIVTTGGVIWQIIKEADTAYHCKCGNPGWNSRSIGIELEGYADGLPTGEFHWQTDAQYSALQDLVSWLAARHGVPVDRAHIIGHNQAPSPGDDGCPIPTEWGGCSNHYDTGPWWNWMRFMQGLGRMPTFTVVSVSAPCSITTLPSSGAPIATFAVPGQKFVAYDAQDGHYLVFLAGRELSQTHLPASREYHWDGWIPASCVNVEAGATQLEVTGVFPARLDIYNTWSTPRTVVAHSIDGKRHVAAGEPVWADGRFWRELYLASADGSVATGWAKADFLTVIPDSHPLNDAFNNAIQLEPDSTGDTAWNGTATKEPGEPNHAGDAGGKSLWWSWTPQVSRQVTVSTVGSFFDTLLAVYTGGSVAGLTLVVQDDDSGGDLTSQASFTAASGITYYIAVDGFAGDSGVISLNLTPANPQPIPSPPRLKKNGAFAFSLRGIPGVTTYQIEVSDDLEYWTPLAPVESSNNVIQFTDADAMNHAQRFYRVVAR